jgi:hypothetical protein
MPLIAVADSSIITGHGSSDFMVVHNTVWVNRNTAYAISAISNTQLMYVKTTDGGHSWGSPVQIDDPTPLPGYDINSFDVWFDNWTPGITGPYIHIAWRARITSTPNARLWYNRLNTSTDALLLDCNVSDCRIHSSNDDSGIGKCTWANRCVSIIENIDGVVYISTQMGIGFRKSSDNGVTWVGLPIAALTNAPDILAPGPFPGLLYSIGVKAVGTIAINQYDDVVDGWTEITTVSGRNPAYDFKAWALVTETNQNLTYAGISNGVTFRIFSIADTVVTELTSVSGFSANIHDIDLAYDETNDDLYAFYNDGSIKYQQSKDMGLTWEAEVEVTSTNANTMRVPPILLSEANRLMPTFFVNPNWRQNLNFLIIKITEEPEDIDNWLIHFFGVFRFDDPNGRTLAASGIILAIMIGLFVMRIHFIIAGVVSFVFAAGMSQVRTPDDTPLIYPWILLVVLLLVGIAVVLKLLTQGGGSDAAETD